MVSRFKPFLAGCSVAGMILATAAATAETREGEATVADQATVTEKHVDVAKNEQELTGPEEDVQEAAAVLRQLKEQEPELAGKLSDAKGVFVIPDYVTAALLVGGSGGEGVLLSNQAGQWSSPGFYDIGNIDIGLQAGAAAGSIVMVLMSDQAVENFRTDTEFSLTAEAGLTIVNWSAEAAATGGEGDVLVWTDTEGLLAEASIGVGGVSWDEEENREYYNQDVNVDQVLAGDVENPHADVLESEFAEFSTPE